MIFSKKEIPIIVEIGVNHEGSVESAINIMKLAAQAGAKIVKFQSYTPCRFAAANNAERLERVSKFCLGLEELNQIKAEADQLGIQILSTPVTEDWVEKLSPLCPAFKIASGDISFKPVIVQAAETGKPVILSTGASTLEEIDQAVAWVKEVVGEAELKDRLTLMHCVSAYPTPIEQANVLSIPFLKERYGLKVGYSNHVIGITACLAAVAHGAEMLEVHFTDCKEGRDFRDHSLSLEHQDLKMLIQMAEEVRAALGKYGKEPQVCEKEAIPLMRKGIVAARDLKQGETLAEGDLMFARPATQFASNQLHLLIGKTLQKNVAKGFLIEREFV